MISDKTKKWIERVDYDLQTADNSFYKGDLKDGKWFDYLR